MLEIIKERLVKRYNLVPQWYWDRKEGVKESIWEDLEKNDLISAEDAIDYIEMRIEDWATD